MGQSEIFLKPKTSLYLEHSSSISRLTFVRDRVPSHLRGKTQDPLLEDLITNLIEVQKRDTPSLPDNCGHKN